MTPKSSYKLLLLACGAWCALIVTPAVLPLQLASPIYKMLGAVCHQFDSHSLHLFGGKLGVCARCSAIYFGFFLGFLIIGQRQVSSRISPRLWIVLAALPMLIDVLLNATGLHASTTATRLLSGGCFGFAMGTLLAPVIVEAISTFPFHISRRLQHVPKT